MFGDLKPLPILIDALGGDDERPIQVLLGVQEADGVDQDLRLACSHFAEQGVVVLVKGLLKRIHLVLEGLELEGVILSHRTVLRSTLY